MTQRDKQLWCQAMAESVRKHMAYAGVDRQELGRRGFSLSTYDRLMRGAYLPGMPSLIDLAACLEVAPHDLIAWADAERRAIVRREGG